MPLSLVLTFTVLIAWPLVKLVTVKISARIWEEQDRLVDDLLEAYSAQTSENRERVRAVLAREYACGRGSLINLLMPFIALPGSALAVWSLIRKKDVGLESKNGFDAIRRSMLINGYSAEFKDTIDALVDDWRFRKLCDQAFDLELLRFPFASALTIVAFFPALAFLWIATGLSASMVRAGKNLVEMSFNVVNSFSVFSGKYPCV